MFCPSFFLVCDLSHLNMGNMHVVIAECFVQVFSLLAGVRKFGDRGLDAAVKEIAQIQNVSINTVLGRMHYAVRSLRRLLRNE